MRCNTILGEGKWSVNWSLSWCIQLLSRRVVDHWAMPIEISGSKWLIEHFLCQNYILFHIQHEACYWSCRSVISPKDTLRATLSRKPYWDQRICTSKSEKENILEREWILIEYEMVRTHADIVHIRYYKNLLQKSRSARWQLTLFTQKTPAIRHFSRKQLFRFPYRISFQWQMHKWHWIFMHFVGLVI